jgi:hypothetical protein
MDIFRNEESRVVEKIETVVPQLEDIGQRGAIIAAELHESKNALKYPKASRHNLFGSETTSKDVTLKLQEIRNELDDYGEKSRDLIQDITKILTEIRYKSLPHNH